jgi:predicted secreted Zn-dependent protease
METTFDKFITSDPEQKTLFDKEYAKFSHSEKALENLSKEKQEKPFIAKPKTGRRKPVFTYSRIANN